MPLTCLYVKHEAEVISQLSYLALSKGIKIVAYKLQFSVLRVTFWCLHWLPSSWSQPLIARHITTCKMEICHFVNHDIMCQLVNFIGAGRQILLPLDKTSLTLSHCFYSSFILYASIS